jgi:LuxR family maltose regulon positive regulatory protein
VGANQIACERGDLHTTAQHLKRSQELGEHTGLPQNPYRYSLSG